jgi:Concanavalin A-like lectin/glucanases superfamily
VTTAVAGLPALCQCSLFFDLGGLDNGGPFRDSDAATVGDSEPGERDAATDAGGDTGGLDAAVDAGGDAGPLDAMADTRVDARGVDATGDGGNDTGGLDAGADAADAGGLDAAGDASDLDAVADGGGIAVGLVAYYPFDETSGTTSADASGNNQTATMQGATFASGLRGNAATMNGMAQYVSLPGGIVSGLPSFSISAWVLANSMVAHTRIFDFGTGTNTYMFFTPHTTVARFAITTSGANMEQRIDAPVLATASWQHVAVTVAGATGTLYVDGAQVAQNTAMTLNAASLGTTTQNWLGRSQFAADAYLNGQIDEFRIYNRALTVSEVQQLFQLR